MTTDVPPSKNPKAALELKSSTFNIPALILHSNEMAEIEQQLQLKISQAPDFFKNSPLLVELQALTQQDMAMDVQKLIELLRQLHFLPIALSGGNAQQNTTAIELGIAIQSVYTLNTPQITQEASFPKGITDNPPSEETLVIAESASYNENKVITQPVRSGQRIYSKGDLTVLAAVNPGAELMAEGNIHVYAPMRGRALAGVQGNTNSCIFCSNLQAELISIAGIYRLHDDFDKDIERTLVQIYLHEQNLLIKKL